MISRWSSRRKFLVSFFIVLGVLILIGIPVYLATRETPNCSNGKLDGDETGVDCGGSCQLLCTPEILPLVTKGDARLLKIATSTYEAVIVVQNPNATGSITRAPYTFTIFNGASTKPAKVIESDTYVGRSSTFAIFAGPFTLDDASSYRAVFAFTPSLMWQKSSDPLPTLAITDTNLIVASTSAPRLEANLNNYGQSSMKNVEVVAILSDSAGNIIATGKTFVDEVAVGGREPLSFSWPSPFEREAVSVKILPHVLPDRSYLH
jgi:hypothetical protein